MLYIDIDFNLEEYNYLQQLLEDCLADADRHNQEHIDMLKRLIKVVKSKSKVIEP